MRYSTPALAEMVGIYRYIARDNPQAAFDVAQAIGESIELLRRFPEKSRKTDQKGLYAQPLVQYPYIIFFRVRAGELLIAHVLHGARRHPGFQEDASLFAPAV